MILSSTARVVAVLLTLGASAALPLASVLQPFQSGSPSQENKAEPWSNTDLLPPAALGEELQNAKDTAPTIVYVGFRTLFEGGHIPRASFHGTASKEDSLEELKTWAAKLPRSTNLVIYCGCCPFDHCPNIRPAYSALHEMGFTHIRVLALPTSFAADWVEKGYPIRKSS